MYIVHTRQSTYVVAYEYMVLYIICVVLLIVPVLKANPNPV